MLKITQIVAHVQLSYGIILYLKHFSAISVDELVLELLLILVL